MPPLAPIEPDTPDILPLHERAADNLSFIRDTMTRASSFTAVPGWGTVAMGIVALLGGAVAAVRLTTDWWINTWCVVAVIAGGLGFFAVVLKARRTATPLFSGPGRRMIGNFAPPILAGCALTILFYQLGIDDFLAGMWLLLYGSAVTTAGAFSVRIVPALGLCFMALGAWTLTASLNGIAHVYGPYFEPDLAMALGFGGLNIAFGLAIARRHGG